jgi:ABC-type multidrug transport system fused ATPase/permease subunit
MRKNKGKLRSSGIRRTINVLSKADQYKIVLVVGIQILMGILDLLGVLAIGLLGALSVSGIQSGKPGDRVSAALDLLHISNMTFQAQAIVISLLAVVLLIGRTALSIFFTRRILFFLSHRGAKLSAELISKLLSQPLLKIQQRTTQETMFAVTTGVSLLTLQVLAVGVVLISDVALLVIMAVGLFIVDPMTAVTTFTIFLLIGYLLYRFMHIRAGSLGVKNSILNIKSNEKIVEVFSAYRESVVRNRRDYYAREIGKLRFSLAETSAELTFMPYVSKYVIETVVIVGALVLGAGAFVFQDAKHAVATLAIFLTAGTRIAPAVLRIQQSLVQIRGSLGQSSQTLDLIEELESIKLSTPVSDELDLDHVNFKAEVHASNISLSYPNKTTAAVSGINLRIEAGALVAIVGPSGAGKTTVVDILLGVLPPDEGLVTISGLSPHDAVSKWPGAIAYVPQDVSIAAGSIRENVALGYPMQVATDELVMNALRSAQLADFVSALPDGIDTQVGERGSILSGGQRQRLGIARALFTQPHLIVMDEATSALDGEAEAGVTAAIQTLRGAATVIVIAHRLSTIRNADTIIYMDNGKIIGAGKFEALQEAIPDFKNQAKLMGL